MQTKTARRALLLLLCMLRLATGADFSARFEEIKKNASPAQLYALLFDLPKGGDLHHHNSLDTYATVWYAIATSPKTLQRNAFYTLTKFENCPGSSDSLPRFYNLQRATYAALTECEKSQYQSLVDLSPELKAAWISSLILDRPAKARDEFFERIVPRFGDLTHDPYLVADVMVENMRFFGAEKVRYIETQIVTEGFLDASGKPMPMEQANQILCERLRQPDAIATGVQMRFIDVIIRFLPDAEHKLELAYDWVAHHRDQWVGINMAGREDNDKGYPLRFLETYRKMRRTYSDIPLSIHGGEKDNPGHDVRDTLLLGASRIGHGLNLITDPDTMLLMRHGQVLVEINLVSNHVLQYFPDLTKHPFPEYLRFGIPVCLNTDDRGSWDSNMTDEYYTAVKTFNLSWKELVELGRNSLAYSFAESALKEKMLRNYNAEVAAFESRYQSPDWRDALKPVKPLVSGYAQRSWGLHE
jgi:adenosine deaminase CECR1